MYQYVIEGMSNKKITTELHVTVQTVKNHMTHISEKLKANDKSHALVIAFRLGLLDLIGGSD
jgi:DNA-binding NarL/FixJ family response regulator